MVAGSPRIEGGEHRDTRLIGVEQRLSWYSKHEAVLLGRGFEETLGSARGAATVTRPAVDPLVEVCHVSLEREVLRQLQASKLEAILIAYGNRMTVD
jgi:hypothetical protein